jgi:hypothetical protein
VLFAILVGGKLNLCNGVILIINCVLDCISRLVKLLSLVGSIFQLSDVKPLLVLTQQIDFVPKHALIGEMDASGISFYPLIVPANL